MPLQGMMGMQQESNTNLLSVLINIAFGYILGLAIFLGLHEVISYGSKLAGELIKLTGYGQQMQMFGLATSAAPYIVLAPLGGMVVKQLSSVRSLKSFAYFVLAVLAGVSAAYLTQSYVVTMMAAKTLL